MPGTSAFFKMAATMGDLSPERKGGLATASMPQNSDNVTDLSSDPTLQTSVPIDTSSLHLYEESKAKFNEDRKILIKNVPTSASIEDLQTFLQEYRVKNIDLTTELREAIIVLEDGEEAEDLVKTLDNSHCLDEDVSVCISPRKGFVCMAHLPLTYSDEELEKLASKHGQPKGAFLMRHRKTGAGLGYGFVEYEESSQDVVQTAVSELDWTEVGGRKIHVELIEENQQSWSQLQSRCILIDNLPEDFTDISKLRNIFSCVTSPLYCQIAVRDGKSIGYALVEFHKAEDAEETWLNLSGHMISDTPISMSFCIPGRSAIVIYNRLTMKLDAKLESTKKSLLPDPLFVSPSLLNSPLVKGLKTQFAHLVPNFMKSLQDLHEAYIKSVMSRNAKPGLLGPAPFPAVSPIMNPKMQLGLIIFLVVQMHAKQPVKFTGPLAHQLNLLGEHTGQKKHAATGAKPSLLGDPTTARAVMLVNNLQQQLSDTLSSSSSEPVSSSTSTGPKPLMSIQIDPASVSDEDSTAFYEENLQNVKNLNLNLLMNLGQIVLSMESKEPELVQHDRGKPPSRYMDYTKKEGLLPNPGRVTSQNSRLQQPSMGNGYSNPRGVYDRNRDQNNYQNSYGGQNYQNSYSGQNYGPNYGGGVDENTSKSSLLGQPPSRIPGMGLMDQGYYSRNTAAPSTSYPSGSNMSSSEGNTWSYNEQDYSQGQYWDQQQQQNQDYNQQYGSYYQQEAQSSYDYNGYYLNNSGNTNNNSSSSSSLMGNFNIPQSGTDNRYNDPSSSSYSGDGGLLPMPSLLGSSPFTPPAAPTKTLSTPVGQKRNYSSLLPPPEQSPEGEYSIGQHSQGIGGHYADSYCKRQKLDHRYTSAM